MSIFSPNTEKYEPAITPYLDTFHVVSKKIIEEINERNNICLNMQPPEDLKGGPIVGGPNFPTQGISGLLEKILTPIVSRLKTYINYDWDFIRKLPSHVDYTCLLASWDVVSLYTSIPHGLGLEALSYWTEKKRNLIPKHFTKAVILEAASFICFYSYLVLQWVRNLLQLMHVLVLVI